MSNNLPAALPKTMPINAVVDYSGQISQTELGTLNLYATRMHYSPHVVLLPAASKGENTQAIALQIAKTWNLEPNGFLLVINPAGDTAAMVAGVNLQSKGISGRYINSHLMPDRFEKQYALGNTYGAIRTTMSAVEHKLNVVALQGQPVRTQTHSNPGATVGITFVAFFIFMAILVYAAGKSSVAPRRMRLEGSTYEGDSDLSADLARIHQLMGEPSPTKQVPMKEFAQRASTSRSTQDSLDALPFPKHESEFPHRSSANLTDYGSQMIAQDEDVEQKIIASDKKKPLKLIFEGAHAGEKFAAPTPSEQEIVDVPVSSDVPAETPFAIPTFKPYEFSEDETAVPSVGSLQPASDVAIPDPDPGLITVPSVGSVAPVAPAATSVTSALIAQVPPAPASSNETTETVLKVDQFAQAMTSEPDQAAGLAAWKPPTYAMPPTPVMPLAPTLPVSHFNNSFSTDFADILSSSTANIGSAVTNQVETSSPSGATPASVGVCPQCQSEKSPDFSFCLRCGHMFV